MELKDKDSLEEAFQLFREIRAVDKKKALKRFEKEISSQSHTALPYMWKRVVLYGAAGLIPALLLLNAYLLYNSGNASGTLSNSRPVRMEVTAMNGTRVFYTLPDSTSVWLRGGSILIYDANMEKSAERHVQLIGEGYFEVKSDKKKTFIVSLNNLNVTVTGTAFNCNTDYQDQIQLTLVEGEVEMSKKTSQGELLLTTLTPGRHFQYNTREETFHVKDVDVRKYTCWKDGYLLFDDDPMTDVVERISHWYGVDIIIADKEIENMRFTAMFNDLKLTQIIDILELASNMTSTYIKGTIEENGKVSKEQLILRMKK